MRKLVIRLTDSLPELMFWYGCVIFAATCGFHYFEDKPWDDSLWWSFVTATTTGFGDIYPVTNAGRAVCVALMHVVHWLIWPLIVLRFIRWVDEDKHQFTDEEQKFLVNGMQKLLDRKALDD